MTVKKAPRRPPSSTYMSLIRSFPLRPLRTDREYEAAVAILDSLVVRPEGSLDPDEQDYLETLTLLVEARDRELAESELANDDPVDTLRYLMEQSGLSRADLGRLLGNRALASLILNRQRAMSKTVIRKLANHFQLSPSLFLK